MDEVDSIGATRIESGPGGSLFSYLLHVVYSYSIPALRSYGNNCTVFLCAKINILYIFDASSGQRGAAHNARATQPAGRGRAEAEHQSDNGDEPRGHPRPGAPAARPHRPQDRIPGAQRGRAPRHPAHPLAPHEPHARHQPAPHRRAAARRFGRRD